MSLSADDRRALADRRARVMAAMDDGVMLLAAAPERRPGDVLYPYRQDSDFDYLTGLGEPDADDVPPQFRGIGIRIEDDVHVTPTGVEMLSAAAPKQIEELESLRAQAS
jgi:Xaa-Pro aminopeptidase